MMEVHSLHLLVDDLDPYFQHAVTYHSQTAHFYILMHCSLLIIMTQSQYLWYKIYHFIPFDRRINTSTSHFLLQQITIVAIMAYLIVPYGKICQYMPT
jgi:hypothetical protein